MGPWFNISARECSVTDILIWNKKARCLWVSIVSFSVPFSLQITEHFKYITDVLFFFFFSLPTLNPT